MTHKMMFKRKFLTFSWQRVMVAVWMLAMAFAAGGFIWYGIFSWFEPWISILNIALGIWIILVAVMRIVEKELEGKNHGSKER